MYIYSKCYLEKMVVHVKSIYRDVPFGILLHNFATWPFIVSFPSNNGDFVFIVILVYQRYPIKHGNQCNLLMENTNTWPRYAKGQRVDSALNPSESKYFFV